MSGARVWSSVKQTFSEFFEDKALRLAAATALLIMLSLAPLLVITIKIGAVALGRAAAEGNVQEAAAGFVGQQGGAAINEMVQNAGRPGSGRLATALSVVLLLASATGLFASVQDALNTIWDVQPKPDQGVWATIRVRLWSLLLVVCVAALLLASVALSTFIHTLTDNLSGPLLFLSYVGDIVVSLAVTTVLFALVFKFLPDVKIAWKHVWVG